MKVIGTKFCGHDSALCYIDSKNKEIFAISTERVTRIKHDFLDISPILKAYKFSGVDYVAHSYSDFEDKSNDGELREKMTFNKDIERAIRSIIRPKYIKDLIISRKDKNKLILKALFTNFKAVKEYYLAKIRRAQVKETPAGNKKAFTNYIFKIFGRFNLKPREVYFFDHHLCHAIPSYFMSPYNGEKAIALTLDGQGDGFFSKLFFFSEDGNYELIGESSADYLGKDDWYLSIGRIYNYFTRAMGLRANSDEGKVEALAAFGKADRSFLKQLKATTKISKKHLSIVIDKERIEPFYDLDFLKAKRIEIGDENFCAVVQTYLEDTVVKYLDVIYEKYKINNLCLSGGVAANIIMSLNIYERTSFKNIYVLPPMGDEGLALGSAILTLHKKNIDISWLRNFHMPYFGDSYTTQQVEAALQEFDNIDYQFLSDKWPESAAGSVAKGKICSLFHGRMEFGPRALGNRSIVGNPMNNDTRDKINTTVKLRPSYQPFCPSILEEERERLFSKSYPHKHMAIAFRMKEEHIKSLPCAVHVDGTARPQFVEKEDNLMYFNYLKHLKKLTGYGVSLNTSFNLHGRTIVRTPQDAVIDFIDCNIDELYIEGFKVTRKYES